MKGPKVVHRTHIDTVIFIIYQYIHTDICNKQSYTCVEKWTWIHRVLYQFICLYNAFMIGELPKQSS